MPPPRPALARRPLQSVGAEDIGLPDPTPLGRIRNPAAVQSARNSERVVDAAWQRQQRALEEARSCVCYVTALLLCNYRLLRQRTQRKLPSQIAPYPHPAPVSSPAHRATPRRRLLFTLQKIDAQPPHHSRR